MSSSRHRLTLTERKRAVETVYTLEDVETRYRHYHEAAGHTRNAIVRHLETQKLFHRFLMETGRPLTTRSLTSQTMADFAIWLRDTPVRERRGSTTRSVFGTHAHLRDMRAFTRWLTAEGYIAPVKVLLPKLPDKLFPILSDEQMRQVWKSKYLVGNSPLATRNRALLGLMIDTGLRRGEIAGLHLADVELHYGMLTVTGKGNKQRRVPFSSNVTTLLEAWLVVRGSEPGSLFHLSAEGIKTTFTRIREDVGVPIFHAHQCRHHAATMLVRNNADLESVRRILGHSDLATTARYLSMSDEDLRAKHAAASPFDTLFEQTREATKPRRRRLSLKAS